MKEFEDKVVVVTGASSGIGLACVRNFASQGANVVLAARDIDKLHEISSELTKEFGVRSAVFKSDVSREESCRALIEGTIEAFGRIDVLVCNAGLSMRALFADVDLEVLRRLMDVNFWGMVYCCKYALKYVQQSKGTIVGMSSVAGFKGLPGRSGYSASKFAMQGFLESLRLETFQTGINILIASPGFTASNIRKVALGTKAESIGETNLSENRLMTAEEVASRIVRAVFLRRRSVVLTTQGKTLFWLNKFLPSLSDRLVYRNFAKELGSLIK